MDIISGNQMSYFAAGILEFSMLNNKTSGKKNCFETINNPSKRFQTVSKIISYI